MRKIFFYFVSFLIVLSLFSSVLAWDSERPRGHVTINERAENSATDGKASVGVGVHVVGYLENWPEWPSLGCDLVELRIIGTANTRQIISYSVQSDYYSWHWKATMFQLQENDSLTSLTCLLSHCQLRNDTGRQFYQSF